MSSDWVWGASGLGVPSSGLLWGMKGSREGRHVGLTSHHLTGLGPWQGVSTL